MDRVEFIRKTCIDDSSKEAILEHFWDQYMLLYGLAGSVEEVGIAGPFAIGSGIIAFRLRYRDKDSMLRAESIIQQNNVLSIYEGQHSVDVCSPDESNLVMTVKIKRIA